MNKFEKKIFNNMISYDNLFEFAGSVYEQFLYRAGKAPNKSAVVHGDHTVSYAKLNEMVSSFANMMSRMGIKKGDRVGIYMVASVDFVAAIYAVMKLRAVFLPLDKRHPKIKIQKMICDGMAKLVLSDENNIFESGEDFVWINVNENLKSNINIKCVDEIIHNNNKEFIYLMYTSGSTGAPKGVLVKDIGVRNLVLWYIDFCKINEKDKILILSPIGFDLTYKNIFSSLSVGAELHLVEVNPFDPLEIASYIIVKKITFFNGTPSVLYQILNNDFLIQDNNLRHICFGGEEIDAIKLQDFSKNNINVEYSNTYGPTECTDLACAYKFDRKMISNGETIPIGEMISNVNAVVLDEHMKVCGVDKIGELYIYGIGVTDGYINNHEETKINFLDISNLDGLEMVVGTAYKSGDLVKMTSSGRLIYVGRVDDQIKLNGLRIEPREIEDKISLITGLKWVKVHKSRFDDGGSKIDVYLLTENKEVDFKHLKKMLTNDLPDYMIPACYYGIKSIPISINGKLDKKKMISERFEFDYKVENQLTTDELSLIDIWSDILKIPKRSISINDDFFKIGGYSIVAIQVCVRVKKIFDVDISIIQFYNNQTIKSLAKLLVALRLGFSVESNGPVRRDDAIKESSLSFQQQRIWFLSKLLPDSGFYNLPEAFLVEGFLDKNILKKSFYILVNRHDILRTLYFEKNGLPFQVRVNDIDKYSIYKELDLSDEIDPVSVSRMLISNDSGIAFNLLNELPIKLEIHYISNEKNIIYLKMHHIAMDGWSWNLVKKEISDIYNSLLSGNQFQGATIEVSYIDYVLWQQSKETHSMLKKGECFWVEYLRNVNSINLPEDKKEFIEKTYSGKRIRRSISSDQFRDLYNVARSEGITTFNALITLFSIALFRFSGNDEISVATPSFNRPYESLEGVIGCYINTLIFYTKIQLGMKLFELLQCNKEILSKMLTYQYYPFELLVDKLDVKRDINNNPFSNVLFVFQEHNMEIFNLGSGKIKKVDIDTNYSRFDMEWQVWVQDENLYLDIFYNDKKWDENTIIKLIDDYIRLIRNISSQVNCSIEDIYYLEHKNLSVLYGPLKNNYKNSTIMHWIDNQIKKVNSNLAITCENEFLTYGELGELIDKQISVLLELNLKKSDKVILIANKSILVIAFILACFKTGIVYVPFSPINPEDRLNFVISDLNPKQIFYSGCDLSFYDKNNYNLINLDSLMSNSICSPNKTLEISISADDPAYIIYTSGSTGLPKGVVVTHLGLANVVMSISNNIELMNSRAWASLSELSFDISLLEILAPLCSGIILIIYPDTALNSIDAIKNDLKSIEGLIIQATPSCLSYILDSNPMFLRNTKIISGGEMLSANLAKKLLETGSKIYNAYGPTETSIWSTMVELDFKDNYVTIGRPIDNTNCYIINHIGLVLPKNCIGELYISGSGVALGYVNELNPLNFLEYTLYGDKKFKCYKTGDYAYLNQDNKLVYIGRVDNQFKINGYRIDAAEIEYALLSQSYVKQAAVIKYQDDTNTNPVIKAFISIEDEVVLDHSNECSVWEGVFNSIYKNSECKGQDKFRGWYDSYRHQPFSEECLDDWLYSAVKSIKHYEPKNIVEIGCGLGLLVSKLVDDVDSYVATDLAIDAIDALSKNNFNPKVVYKHANAFEAISYINSKTSCVIMSSVIQYFPSLSYLNSLILKITQEIADNGIIYIGDVRWLELKELYQESIDYFLDLNRSDKIILKKSDALIPDNNELFVSPAFFNNLKLRYNNITYVEIFPKLGSLRNELNVFRYDVILHIKSKMELCENQDIVIYALEDNANLHKLEDSFFKNSNNNSFLIRNIKNKMDFFPMRSDADLILNNQSKQSTIAPFELLRMAQINGFDAKFCLSKKNENIYDAYIYKKEKYRNGCVFEAAIEDHNKTIIRNRAGENSSFINKEHFLSNVKDNINKVLPYYATPENIIIVDNFSLNSNGKIDKKILKDKYSITKEQKESVFDMENLSIRDVLVSLWNGFFPFLTVSSTDNFFNLGGNSLKALELISRCNQVFKVNSTLYDFYKNPVFSNHLSNIISLIMEREQKVNITISNNSNIKKAFMIHPIDGMTNWYAHLISSLGDEYEFICINQDLGFKDDNSIEKIAIRYKKIIINSGYSEGSKIFGWSFGGIIAFEICNQLKKSGYNVMPPILIDAPAPNCKKAIFSANNNINTISSNNLMQSEKCILLNSKLYIKYNPQPPYVEKVILLKAELSIPKNNFDLWGGLVETESYLVSSVDHYSILGHDYVYKVVEIISKLNKKVSVL